MRLSRRALLRAGTGLAGAAATALLLGRAGAAGGVAAGGALAGRSEKRVSLLNLHTGEHVDVAFSREGAYLPDALDAIEIVLRDFRNGERHPVDPQLLDYLVEVAERLQVPAEFSVISGYRSPESNQMLHERSSGVAQHSLHMQGRAIDVRMTHVDCADLAAQALDLKRGGVGYYKASNFVHLDTGAFRTWRG